MRKLFKATALFIAIASSQQAFAKEVLPALPPAQSAFVETIANFGKQYKEAPNQLKKSALVSKRTEALSKIKGGLRNVSGWYGVIKSMGTTGDGDAYVIVEIPEADITLGTWNNAFSDAGSGSLIKGGTKLYDKVSDLEEGKVVKFSGSIGKPKNFTESGQMTDPDFLFKFSSIEAGPAAQ
jgi:hypothetical protein